EFWCTAIAYDPNPPTDNSNVRPLKEYMIKFLVMNGKRPLTLEFKTFTESETHMSVIPLLRNDPTSFYYKEEEREVSDCKKSDPKNSVGNIQSIDTRLPSMVSDPKNSVGNIQSIDTRLPSMVSNKGMVKTTSLPEGLHGDKDSEGNKAPTDIEPINPTIVDLLGTGAKYQVDETHSTRLRYRSLPKNKGQTSSEDEMAQESDDEEVFVVGEDMDADTHADEEEYQQLVKYLRKVSRVLFKIITEEQWAQHIEAAVSYADLIASIIGYYEKNVDHKEKTNKVIDVAINSPDKQHHKG
nr:hypothetical protein [Tanacetum cinerariifolium]